jgi:hypothetical protein
VGNRRRALLVIAALVSAVAGSIAATSTRAGAATCAPGSTRGRVSPPIQQLERIVGPLRTRHGTGVLTSSSATPNGSDAEVWFDSDAASWFDANLGRGRAGEPIGFFRCGTTGTFVCGDWNGDGRDTSGVVQGNVWYLSDTVGGAPANVQFAYGRPDDFPLPPTSRPWCPGRPFYKREASTCWTSSPSPAADREGTIPMTT